MFIVSRNTFPPLRDRWKRKDCFEEQTSECNIHSLDASRSLTLSILKVSTGSSSTSTSHTEEEASTEQTSKEDNAHNDNDDQSVVSLLSDNGNANISGKISTDVSAQQSVGSLLLLSGGGSILSINVDTSGKSLAKISILHAEGQLSTSVVGRDGSHGLILEQLKVSLSIAEGDRSQNSAGTTFDNVLVLIAALQVSRTSLITRLAGFNAGLVLGARSTEFTDLAD